MTVPAVRALMESGATWDEPSEDLVFQLLGDIERGEEQFVVLERVSDPSGQTYAQAIRDEGKWLVERRDGSPDKHYRVTLRDRRAAHKVLTAWAFDLPGWQQAAKWERTVV